MISGIPESSSNMSIFKYWRDHSDLTWKGYYLFQSFPLRLLRKVFISWREAWVMIDLRGRMKIISPLRPLYRHKVQSKWEIEILFLISILYSLGFLFLSFWNRIYFIWFFYFQSDFWLKKKKSESLNTDWNYPIFDRK